MRKDDEHKHDAGEGDVGHGEAGQGKAGQRRGGASKAGKREAGKAKARKSKAGAVGKTATGKAGAGSIGAGKDGAAAPDTPRPRVRPAPDPRLSRSLEYGVAILETFSAERQELGIARLSDVVGISRSTTHRYAMTLVALGYLEQDTKRKYRLSARAATPGGAAIAAMRRDIHARAVLEELREQTGHTVSMGVLDGARVIYVHRLFGHRAGQYAIDASLGVGASMPAYCTALGKVLLASLSDAERREVLAGLQLKRHGPNTIIEKRRPGYGAGRHQHTRHRAQRRRGGSRLALDRRARATSKRRASARDRRDRAFVRLHARAAHDANRPTREARGAADLRGIALRDPHTRSSSCCRA